MILIYLIAWKLYSKSYGIKTRGIFREDRFLMKEYAIDTMLRDNNREYRDDAARARVLSAVEISLRDAPRQLSTLKNYSHR